MGLNQDVAGQGLLYQVGPFAFSPRVFVWAIVRIRPAVEAAVFDLGHVIRRQIVAHAIAFLHASPKGARARQPGQPDRIPGAAGKDAFARAVRIEFNNCRAHFIGFDIDVRLRSNGHVHLLAITTE